jgi:hypothetical protein
MDIHSDVCQDLCIVRGITDCSHIKVNTCLEKQFASVLRRRARGSIVVKALCYKSEGRGFDNG